MAQKQHRSPGAVVLGSVFIGAGLIQATNRKLFAALVPKQFAGHSTQVQGIMTGVLVGVGVGFIARPLRPISRWAATLMLGGTLPAAIDQVRHPETTDELGLPRRLVIARIPAQVLVIVLAWLVTRRR